MAKDMFDRLIERETADRGESNGISVLTLGKYRGKVMSKADVEALTHEEAKDIYKALYYVAPHIDQLPVMIQDIMLDFAVQSGPHNAIQALQESLNVPVDYAIGPVTIASAFKANQILLLISLVRWRALMLARIVKRDVSQVVQLASWLSRVLSFLPLCEAYYE